MIDTEFIKLLDQKDTSMRLTFALIMALSLLFAGCGVRGPLEPPPGADTSVEAPGKEPIRQENKPDRPFVLDGLLN